MRPSLSPSGVIPSSGDAAPLPVTAPTPENPLLTKMRAQRAAGPGWHGIHNPFLKALAATGDVIGSGIFPEFAQFVPGTTAHHNQILNEEEGQLGQEQKAQKASDESTQSAATAEHEKALTAGQPYEDMLKQAQAGDFETQAYLRAHPISTYDLGSEPLLNPATGKHETYMVNKNNPADKVFLGEPGAKPVAPKTPTNEFEKFFLDNPNAKAEDWAKFQSDHPKPVEWTAEDAALLKAAGGDPKKPDTQTYGVMKKYEDLKKEKISVGADHGVSVVDPKTHQLVRVEPGQSMPEGAVSATQSGQQSLATDKKAQALTDAAKNAQEDYELAQEYAKTPSPTNDFALMMHFIGATKPDSIGKLRLTQNEIKLVLGLRSTFQDVEAWGHKFADGQLLPPEQRQHMLDTMKIIADRAQSHVPVAAKAPGSGDGITLEDINAEVAKRKAAQGKK